MEVYSNFVSSLINDQLNIIDFTNIPIATPLHSTTLHSIDYRYLYYSCAATLKVCYNFPCNVITWNANNYTYYKLNPKTCSYICITHNCCDTEHISNGNESDNILYNNYNIDGSHACYIYIMGLE